MNEKLTLKSNISAIKGVGAKRLALFNMSSIYTVEDLIEYFPRDYVDRSVITPVKHAEIGRINTVKATVSGISDNVRLNGKTISKITARDASGMIEIVWFNRPYMRLNFKIGTEWIFTGKITARYDRLCMECQEYEAVNGKELLSSNRIVPIYRLSNGIKQKFLRKTIHSALESCGELIQEVFPQEMLDSYRLLDKARATANIHFPETDEMFFRARERLVFEELFFMQLALAKQKLFIKSQTPYLYDNTDISPIIQRCSFALTGAQNRVVNEIISDIKGGYVVNRLVQGDVGSGKTMIAIIAAYLAVKNGGQAAVMAPTEILATQHFEAFSEFFEPMGIKLVLLKGSMKKSEKDTVYNEIATGDAKIVIGTHAVIQDKVIFNHLTMVVTDEQHRFGVKQRDKLLKKGHLAHTIVMSATPIPRTLALVLYGDMDISIIDELPPGRKPIETYAVTEDYRERIFAFIEKQCESGRQAYVICPAIEQNLDAENIKDVITYTQNMRKSLPSCKIECLHGKMNSEQKQEIMNLFINGEVDILVATTVIEVGINVPNSTVMLIENAERFGLSQLHQLRGRVGRGAENSYCILITDNKGESAKSRMQTMTKTNNGFEVSEKDLEQRGAGDFFGTKQHGLADMKIVNLYKDIDAVSTVKQAVEYVVNAVRSGENCENLRQLWDIADVSVIAGYRDVL